jgi:Secretion system C-terminal sorting domain
MIRNPTFTLLVFFLMCFSVQTKAASIDASLTGGEWNETTTWIGGNIPTVNDDVNIPTGAIVHIRYITTIYTGFCKSLTINGTLNYSNNNLFVGSTFNSGGNQSLNVFGTLNIAGSYSNNFNINGSLKLNAGSKFNMTSGALVINGNSGNAATSVASGTAIFDINDISQGDFNFALGTIYILNPHFTPNQPCMRGAKSFSGNATISFGNSNEPASATDYIIDPTAKPIFQNFEVNFNGINGSKAVLSDITIKGAFGINKGNAFTGGGTRVYVGGDMNIGKDAKLQGDVEFTNLTAQQNINPLDQGVNTISDFILNGNLIVNSKRVKLKLNLEIENGFKLFFTAGKFDTNYKLFVTHAEPIGYNGTNFIITYDLYREIGTVKIKNISAKTTFPVGYELGEGNFRFTPVEITPTSTSDFTVSAHPHNAPTVTTFDTLALRWDINRTSGSAAADISFQWNETDQTGNFGLNKLGCMVFHYNGTAWDSITTKGVTSTQGATFKKVALNVSNFSPFTIFTSAASAAQAQPLPVSLTEFKAKAVGSKAILTWSTASENNNTGFDIEKSLDGQSFQKIDFVKGNGNSNVLLSYISTDDNFTQTAFYRLKQVDFDGKSAYSRIVQVEKTKNSSVKIYPNPVVNNANLTIELTSEAKELVDVTVVDISGRIIFQNKYDATSSMIQISTQDLTRGLYFVKVQNGLNVNVQKIVKE